MYALAKDLNLDDRRLQELAQNIRLSRATLGSVLEWLESSEVNSELLEQLQGYLDAISADIDELVEALPALLRINAK
jgi:hypothetical protein